MKKSIIFALAATLIMAVSGTAHAQGGMRIALIDVGYIFKQHKGFEAMRKSLEDEVNLANVDFQRRRQELQAKQQQLLDLKKGASQDYTTLETSLARETADMNAALMLERNKFSEQEAKIYYQVYSEIREATKAYCLQNGIAVAMQFNGEQVSTDPSMVQAEVARKIVFYDSNLDITPAVLQQVNARYNAANAGVAPRRQ